MSIAPNYSFAVRTAAALPKAFIEVEDSSRLGGEIWVAGKDPTAVLPRTKGIRIQPAPRGGAADLRQQALRHHLLLEIRRWRVARAGAPDDEQAHKRGPLLARRRCGENRMGRPPRGCSSRPGRRAKANRLHHLLTIWRGVPKRVAMTSLDKPCAGKRMILARMTSRYGDVYFRARVSSFSCSSDVSTMRNGLNRDKTILTWGPVLECVQRHVP
jgi:hypothetical protein